LDNATLRTDRSSAPTVAAKTLGCNDVEELLKCHKNESDRCLLVANVSPYGNNNAFLHNHEKETDAVPTGVEMKVYFDYSSYFRYVGWEGCASLYQRMTDPNEALSTLTQTKQIDSPPGAPVSTTSTIVPAASNFHHGPYEQHNVASPAHRTTAKEGDEHASVGEGLPVQAKRVRPVNTFLHPE